MVAHLHAIRWSILESSNFGAAALFERGATALMAGVESKAALARAGMEIEKESRLSKRKIPKKIRVIRPARMVKNDRNLREAESRQLKREVPDSQTV
ncbi:hypothetical protein PGTUg99_016550 [Puccinia graminis f. sp. tritici]|uniref:Uncharacterized protein n=1 Tax=Puccinia graminis f. sp. tritici TaxID=56615 RepID=A0A5B0M2U9_PUCGR|nr:hypothetical protein PGTUg99_016550 [Puccinia graminis f. sp. tritici]